MFTHFVMGAWGMSGKSLQLVEFALSMAGNLPLHTEPLSQVEIKCYPQVSISSTNHQCNSEEIAITLRKLRTTHSS